MNLFTSRSKNNITLTKKQDKKLDSRRVKNGNQTSLKKTLNNKSFLPPRPSPLKIEKKFFPEKKAVIKYEKYELESQKKARKQS